MLAFFPTVVLHDDDTAGLLAALGNGEKRASAKFTQLFLVQDFDFQTFEGLAKLLGLIGHVARMADIWRQVAKVAGEAHAGGNRCGVTSSLLDAFLVSFVS